MVVGVVGGKGVGEAGWSESGSESDNKAPRAERGMRRHEEVSETRRDNVWRACRVHRLYKAWAETLGRCRVSSR